MLKRQPAEIHLKKEKIKGMSSLVRGSRKELVKLMIGFLLSDKEMKTITLLALTLVSAKGKSLIASGGMVDLSSTTKDDDTLKDMVEKLKKDKKRYVN